MQNSETVEGTIDSFTKKIRRLTGEYSLWEVWRDFICSFAIAISNTVDKTNYDVREAEYMRIIARYSKDDIHILQLLGAEIIAALERNPEQDFLGRAYMELQLNNHWKGQFFTPYNLCRTMAQISCADAAEKVKKNGYISISDPACGAGGTLIAAINVVRDQLQEEGLNWQDHLLFYAQDVDPIVAQMCYIQLSLLGAAGVVKIGDTISEPLTQTEESANIWIAPMSYSSIWIQNK